VSARLAAVQAHEPAEHAAALATPEPRTEDDAPRLAQRFRDVRGTSTGLAAPLSEADCTAQSMPDASPVKWHLAHLTWFFETFVLEPHEPSFRPHHPAYRVLFNSYYNGVGVQHPRPERGLITRPGLAEILAWRQAVDERVLALLARPELPPPVLQAVELGLQHEQQHQELLLTDLLHLLSCNPLAPAYRPFEPVEAREVEVAPATPAWREQQGGWTEIGHGGPGFAFDNECPRHRVWLAPHALARRAVTQREWASFIADGGYRDARWWLAAGWDWVRAQRISAPLHWRGEPEARDATGWQVFTLRGPQPLSLDAPVAHISLYEADAYARWAAAQTGLPLRLPLEAEWEAAAAGRGEPAATANLLESGALRPLPVAAARADDGLFGDVWEWTASAYTGYPGYQPWGGAFGEYNGKFMIDQHVLRGGSCVTPRSHIRASYRNFFPAGARWQFSGLRLARDLTG
jgi:ergothioneine biosynthesis protein EgtB